MRYDYVFIGGGLQNGLLALAIRAANPSARVRVIEREARLGGNHTWSFHVDDLPIALAPVVAPMVAHRWPGYDVAFPGFERGLDHAYAVVTSERFDAVVRDRLRDAIVLGEVTSARPGQVALADGRRFEATVVVDARGPEAHATPATATAWQKFVGLELRFAAPCLPARPLLMDARVEQHGGFRFVYTLPFAADHGLVEDTYFADDATLEVVTLEARVRAYCDAMGWPIAEVVRREAGCLPLPWAEGVVPEPLEVDGGTALLRGGYAGGWFHPVTGYSFPVAARLAAFVAERAPEEVTSGFAALLAGHRRQVRYAHLLNRMLYRHFAPADRWNVLARFYRLPEATVRRFYALDLTAGDRARILCGRPPRGITLRPWRGLEVPR